MSLRRDTVRAIVVSVGFIAVVIGSLIAIGIEQAHSDRLRLKYACINNLRRIQWAKQQWVSNQHKNQADVPTWEDIKPYCDLTVPPQCPSGGTYTFGAVSNSPTCSIPGHRLP